MSLEATAPPIADVARAALREVESLEKAARGAAKALKDLTQALETGDAPKAAAALQKLEKAPMPAVDLSPVVARAKGQLAEEERRLKFYLAKELREAAARAGVEFSVLTTDPPEFRLGSLTAAVDLSRRQSSIRYARLELDRTGTNPEAIVEACRKSQAALEGRAFDAERYFARLMDAYRVHLARTQQAFGTRLDLADLLAEVAFGMQGEKFYEDPQRENFVPYTRVQLAYDLARLRRAGRLSQQGFRLALGSATAGTTKQKSRVLYLEDERGNGQYYLSLWFTREGA